MASPKHIQTLRVDCGSVNFSRYAALMRFSLRSLLYIVIASSLITIVAACTYRYYFPYDSTRSLCGIGNLDRMSIEHVFNLLDQNDIEFSALGLMGMGIRVEKSEYDRAVKILENSANGPDSTIVISRDADGFIWIAGDQSDRFDITFNQHVDQFAQNPLNECSQIVRAIQLNDETTYLGSDKLPLVTRISGCRRKYLGADGSLRTGYGIQIEMVDRINNPNAKWSCGYQIMNDFEEVHGMGGGGWGDLPDH